jgi:hypothetical protein
MATLLEPVPVAPALELPGSSDAGVGATAIDARRRPSGPDEPTANRRGERDLLRVGVGGAVLAFVMLATLYALTIPTYRPPDESSHVAYARELSHGRLPTIETPIRVDGDPRLARVLRSRAAPHRTIWTANHPPLYYVLAATPLRVGTATRHPIGGVQAARLLSVGLSALGLVALAYLILQLAPGRSRLAVAATGVGALVPSFVNVSAMIYNDSLAFLTSTAALAASVVFVVRGPAAVRLGAVTATAGLAALTRVSGLLVAGVAGLAVVVGMWRATQGSVPRRLGRAAIWAGAVGAVVVGVAGWFYLRSLALYGDITGTAALCDHFPTCDAPARSIRGLLSSPGFWLVQQRRLWDVTYDLSRAGSGPTRQLWLLGLLPLAGLLLAGARRLTRPARGRRRPDPGRTVAVALCVLLLGLLQLSVVRFVSDGGSAHVRYLFPGLAVIGLVAAVGLTALPGGRRGLPVVAMLLAMGAANLWVWWRYLDVISITDRPGLLVAVIPLFLVGLGLQAVALWRLEPEAVHPGRSATPRWSPAWRGELNQRDVAELSGTRTSRTFGEE